MRIAIVGTGISGLVAAHRLQREHDVTVFEAADWIGGHTHTVDVETEEGRYAVDTGFIVFNPRRYPGFVQLIDELGVASRPTTMSFGVRCDRSGLEYSAASIRSLFAQRRNLVRPGFWRLLTDIVRFNRATRAAALVEEGETPLGAYLQDNGYSAEFVDQFLIPIAAAIWSTDPTRMKEFPAHTLARFFRNHMFLDLFGRPIWRTIAGGSRTYVDRLIEPFRDRIRLETPVLGIQRLADRVEITTRLGEPAERFDRVVIATHSDQALGMLTDPTDLEKELLSAIPYQTNEVVLHTDDRLLPRRRAAWAAWNAHVPVEPTGRPTLTYNMNVLQGLRSRRPFLVTLNESGSIDPRTVLGSWTYHHPLFTARAVRAQALHDRIDGANRTHYCGAYWGYGFHEDGVQSALRVTRKLGSRP